MEVLDILDKNGNKTGKKKKEKKFIVKDTGINELMYG